MLQPVNKYLVVEPLREEKKESGVLVPNEYKSNDSVFSLVKLLAYNPNSTLQTNYRLVVPTHMIEEIDLFGEKYHVVLENHVVGLLDN